MNISSVMSMRIQYKQLYVLFKTKYKRILGFKRKVLQQKFTTFRRICRIRIIFLWHFIGNSFTSVLVLTRKTNVLDIIVLRAYL